MQVNIISDSSCEVRVDVVGVYSLVLNSVSGMFYPIVLTSRDWFRIRADDGVETVVRNSTEIININVDGLLTRFQNLYQAAYLAEHGAIVADSEFVYEPESNVIIFPGTILECSPNVQTVLGITALPSQHNQCIGSMTGPQFLFIKCDELSSPMRYCNQVIPGNRYASISNILSITLNTFATGYPFSLQGNAFVLDSNQLNSIKMQIVDINSNPITFKNNLLWNFQMDRVSDELDTTNSRSPTEIQEAVQEPPQTS